MFPSLSGRKRPYANYSFDSGDVITSSRFVVRLHWIYRVLEVFYGIMDGFRRQN